MRIAVALAAVLVAACRSSDADGASDETTGAATTTGTTTSDATEGEETDAQDAGAGSSSEDTGAIGAECSVWEQDCAPGDKCVPWSAEPDLIPDDVRCCPTPGTAVPGDECMVQEYFGSCLDNCAEGSLCLDPDNDLVGICQPFCTGTALQPECAPDEGCLIYFAGVPFCFPKCDPLVQDCPAGEGCYPGEEAIGGTDFLCLPHIGFAELGGSCWLLSNCDPGLVCVSPEFFPNCTALKGCCTSLCDITDPGPCDEIDPALECVSCYVGGQEPPRPELTNVGVCIVPG